MSAEETKARLKRPLAVGETHVIVVGVEGVIEAIDEETVTINEIVLPRRLNHDRGVRYLSMLWPSENETAPCTRDHCGGLCEDVIDDADSELRRLQRLIQQDHDEHHDGAMRFCTHLTCREVD